MTDTAIQEFPLVQFRPRRVGHVNMTVSDLETSHRFYHDVIGLEFVFDEPGVESRFYSNGNSHHDIAIGQASDKTLLGRGGHVQKPASVMTSAGLNHFAWEMRTESELVAAIKRGAELGLEKRAYYNHQISHSIYLPEPNGMEIEIYADTHPDFRAIYAEFHDELITEVWDPMSIDGDDGERFPKDFELRPAEGALARPLRTAQVAIVIADLDESIDFYERVVGLTVVAADKVTGRWAIMAGTLGRPDLLLLEKVGHQGLGFHHFTLELESEAELDATIDRLKAAGIDIFRVADHALKRGVVVLDPDGVPVELFAALAVGPDGPTYEQVATPENREFLL